MTIKMIAWNVNGLRSIMKEKYLYDLIEKEKPNIICFGETKLSCPILETQTTLQEKIKEFINKLVIKDNNNKYKLEKDLVNLIKLKKLTKKDSVYYNEGTGEIISIPCLSFKKNKYIIEKE